MSNCNCAEDCEGYYTTAVVSGQIVNTWTTTKYPSCGGQPCPENYNSPLVTLTGLSILCVGSTITITPSSTGGTWSSSNTTVATVNTSGVVTGVAAGTTVITYTLNSFSYTHSITVYNTANVTLTASSTCAGNITIDSNTRGGNLFFENNPYPIPQTFTLPVGDHNFSYSGTTSNGCSFSKELLLTVVTNTGELEIIGPTELCKGESHQYTAEFNEEIVDDITFTSTIGTLGTHSDGLIQTEENGTFTLTAQYSSGCINITTTITISIFSADALFTIDDSICIGQTYLLQPNFPGGVFTATGGTINNNQITITGENVSITYTITECGGLSHTITKTATGISTTITGPTDLCESASYTGTITGSNCPIHYQTTGGTINEVGNFTASAGTYIIQAVPGYKSNTVKCFNADIIDVLSPTRRKWMDRNLGALRVATSMTDTQAYGDLYQWGRRADGHQCRNSQEISIISNTTTPSHGNFITTTSNPFNWTTSNTNLWINDLNNPCPCGYRVPTLQEWQQEISAWTNAYDSVLKLPKSASRGYDGDLMDVSYYWTSTTNGSNSQIIKTDGTYSSMGRGFGAAVRCIKENTCISVGSIQVNVSQLQTSTITGPDSICVKPALDYKPVPNCETELLFDGQFRGDMYYNVSYYSLFIRLLNQSGEFGSSEVSNDILGFNNQEYYIYLNLNPLIPTGAIWLVYLIATLYNDIYNTYIPSLTNQWVLPSIRELSGFLDYWTSQSLNSTQAYLSDGTLALKTTSHQVAASLHRISAHIRSYTANVYGTWTVTNNAGFIQTSTDYTQTLVTSTTGVMVHLVGIAPGEATITFTADCYNTSTKTVTINSHTAVAPILGDATIIVGSTAEYTCVTPGGTWSTSDSSILTVTNGLVTGVSPGEAYVKYRLSPVCWPKVSCKKIEVINCPQPAVIIRENIIGSYMHGGIVFHLDGTGQHGLVCAPSDQGAFKWGCVGTSVNTQTGFGTGQTNTNLILSGCGERPIAASVCADLVLNGYDDWFLPSRDELGLMRANLYTQGIGGFVNAWYWSSSQSGANYAWFVIFANGYANYFNKANYDPRVRAVRAF